MIYWKNNIIFTNSTKKPLQKARKWFNGMTNNVCFIKPILSLPWQIKLNTKIRLFIGSNLPWTLRNSGKKALGLDPSVSETQLCIHTTLSVGFFHFKSQAPGSVGCISPQWSVIEIPVTCETPPASSTRRGSIKTNESADSAHQTPKTLQESCRKEMGS